MTSARRRWVVGLGIFGVAALAGLSSTAPAGEAKDSPFREPVALILKAQAAYDKVKDYTCLFIKREKLDGQMSPDNVVEMKVRTSPFSVAMKWQQPRSLVGQEAVYVAGLHNGKFRGKSAGLLGAVGFLTLAVDDPRVKKTSRHPITNAGIGHVIAEARKAWEGELKNGGAAKVKVGAFSYAKKKCTRVELVYGGAAGSRRYARNAFYFDQATHLPIRVENYEWPAKAGGEPELVEVYGYINMRLNVGLGDDVFKK